MEIRQNEVHEIVRNIWESVLGWRLEPTAERALPPGNAGFRTGFVLIAGAWEGAVVCIISETLLRRAAATMFDLSPDALPIELLHDALGEMTNMVGGNLKALLPRPSYLCLPAVVEGSDYSTVGLVTTSVVEAAFQKDGLLFMVKLLAGGSPPPVNRPTKHI